MHTKFVGLIGLVLSMSAHASVSEDELGKMVLGANFSQVNQPYNVLLKDKAPMSYDKNKKVVYGSGYHPGIDYRASVGKDVLSPVDGVVAATGDAYNTIAIKVNGSNTRLLFMHMSSSLVRVGQKVVVGCIIGRSGDKLAPGGAHLHVEARNGVDNGAFYFVNQTNTGSNVAPGSMVSSYKAPRMSIGCPS